MTFCNMIKEFYIAFLFITGPNEASVELGAALDPEEAGRRKDESRCQTD